MEKKKCLKILSHGVFYTPIDTPAHKKGWWAEIVFMHDPTNKHYINRPPISKRFETEEEAKKFINQQRMKLYMARNYYVRETSNEEIRESVQKSGRANNYRS
jgi:hypothetical protein